jgi:hypothetical protein
VAADVDAVAVVHVGLRKAANGDVGSITTG